MQHWTHVYQPRSTFNSTTKSEFLQSSFQPLGSLGLHHQNWNYSDLCDNFIISLQAVYTKKSYAASQWNVNKEKECEDF